jgi:hypothetical protein
MLNETIFCRWNSLCNQTSRKNGFKNFEARDLSEVKEIVACEGVYRILLDNLIMK